VRRGARLFHVSTSESFDLDAKNQFSIHIDHPPFFHCFQRRPSVTKILKKITLLVSIMAQSKNSNYSTTVISPQPLSLHHLAISQTMTPTFLIPQREHASSDRQFLISIIEEALHITADVEHLFDHSPHIPSHPSQ
jgi:hypothetical protein